VPMTVVNPPPVQEMSSMPETPGSASAGGGGGETENGTGSREREHDDNVEVIPLQRMN
jgi:hypothetical protein